MIDLPLKLVDAALPHPALQTKGAAAFDLCARVATRILPHQIAYIPLNVIVQIPDGYWGLLAARSSTHKLGLMLANGLGLIDRDFCGPNDELNLVAFNFTDQPVEVKRGDRVAQFTLIPQPEIQLVDRANDPTESRGAFGTTGL